MILWQIQTMVYTGPKHGSPVTRPCKGRHATLQVHEATFFSYLPAGEDGIKRLRREPTGVARQRM